MPASTTPNCGIQGADYPQSVLRRRGLSPFGVQLCPRMAAQDVHSYSGLRDRRWGQPSTPIGGPTACRITAGLITRFEVAQTCGSDWAFIPVPAPAPNQTLTTPQMRTGVCQAGAITFEPLASPAPNQDFSAVLFGDVTGNWQPTTPTPTPTPTA